MNRYLLIGLIVSCRSLWGQDFASPSLSAGVGKVIYEKGTLDAALVAELIATKQDEVKKELAKRWIQNSVSGGSYVMKSFITKNLEILLSGSSVDIIKKEMLKNAAELALVLGVAEFYLQDLRLRCQSLVNADYINPYTTNDIINSEEIDFVLDYGRSLDPINRLIFFNDFFINSGKYDTTEINSLLAKVDLYRKSLSKKILHTERIKNDLIFYKALSLKEKVIMSVFYFDIRPFSEDEPYTAWTYDKFNIIDSDVLKSQSTVNADRAENALKGLNVRKPVPKIDNYLAQPVLLATYKNKSKYSSERKGRTKFWSPNHILLDLVFMECISSEPIKQLGFFHNLNADHDELLKMNMLFTNDNRAYFANLITKELKQRIDYIFSNYAIFSSIGEVENVGPINPEPQNADAIKDLINSALIASSNVRHRVGNYKPSQEEEEIFKNLYKIFVNDRTEPIELNDKSSYLKNTVLPILNSLNLKTNSSYEDLQNILQELSIKFRELAINKLSGQICGNGNNCLGDELKKYKSYIQLAQAVSQLDKLETYDNIIKFISDIGAIYSDRSSGAVVNSFVNAYEKYVLLVKDENKIKIDVEAVATDLYDKYTKNARSNFGLLFTVGLNYAHQNFLMPREETTGERVRLENDITFVGEKVGVKWKILNYSKRRSMGYHRTITPNLSFSNRTPFVTDIHAIAYGSGLLYKISELNSNTNQLNKPIAGLSFGMSFFNGLDLNAGVAAQVGLARNLFYNLSFDINFMEYLTALKKRKSN